MKYLPPREKAEELVNTVKKIQGVSGLYPVDKNTVIFMVKEIIKALQDYDDNTENYLREDFPKYSSAECQNMENDFRYWSEVLNEVESLELSKY
jgi:DNA-binding Lrp family transcriptional regulator